MQPLGQHMIIEHRKQGSYDISFIPNQEKSPNFTVEGSVDKEKKHLLNRTEEYFSLPD